MNWDVIVRGRLVRMQFQVFVLHIRFRKGFSISDTDVCSAGYIKPPPGSLHWLPGGRSIQNNYSRISVPPSMRYS